MARFHDTHNVSRLHPGDPANFSEFMSEHAQMHETLKYLTLLLIMIAACVYVILMVLMCYVILKLRYRCTRRRSSMYFNPATDCSDYHVHGQHGFRNKSPSFAQTCLMRMDGVRSASPHACPTIYIERPNSSMAMSG